MSDLKIAHMYDIVAEMVWEELTEHQRRHKWRISRSMSIEDLIHDLMAAYDQLAVAQAQADITPLESED